MRDILKDPSKEQVECHHPKPILLDTGEVCTYVEVKEETHYPAPPQRGGAVHPHTLPSPPHRLRVAQHKPLHPTGRSDNFGCFFSVDELALPMAPQDHSPTDCACGPAGDGGCAWRVLVSDVCCYLHCIVHNSEQPVKD